MKVTITYDPDTDVLRVLREGVTDSVDVPLEGEYMTVLVTEDLDTVVGIVIDDIPAFSRHWLNTSVEGKDLLSTFPHFDALMSLLVLLIQYLSTVAKTSSMEWDKLFSSLKVDSV